MDKRNKEHNTKCKGCRLYYPKYMIENKVCIVCCSTLPTKMIEKLLK